MWYLYAAFEALLVFYFELGFDTVSVFAVMVFFVVMAFRLLNGL